MFYPSNAFYSQELTEGYRLVHCVGLAFIFWMAFYSQYVFCGEECFNLTKYENLHFAQVCAVSFLIDWLLGPYHFSVTLGSCHFNVRLGSCHFSVRLGPCHFSVRLGSYHFSIRLGSCHFGVRLGSCHFSVRLGSCHFSVRLWSSPSKV